MLVCGTSLTTHKITVRIWKPIPFGTKTHSNLFTVIDGQKHHSSSLLLICLSFAIWPALANEMVAEIMHRLEMDLHTEVSFSLCLCHHPQSMPPTSLMEDERQIKHSWVPKIFRWGHSGPAIMQLFPRYLSKLRQDQLTADTQSRPAKISQNHPRPAESLQSHELNNICCGSLRFFWLFFFFCSSTVATDNWHNYHHTCTSMSWAWIDLGLF